VQGACEVKKVEGLKWRVLLHLLVLMYTLVYLNVHGMKIKKRSCGPSKENLKFTLGARNYKDDTAIGGRSALDLRAEVGVWCMVVTF
jgi:uncharacterized ion transporter superfamily protein YfcC